MPFGDGTGPLGFGPGTGRRRGLCQTGMRMGGWRYVPLRGKNRWLLGLAVPIIAAVLRDLANPRGLIRQACAAFFPKSRPMETKRPIETRNFSVVENASGRTDQRK